MAYGDTTRARVLAGNPSTNSVSNNDVTQAVAFGDSKVNTITQKSDWTSSDSAYAQIQSASEYFASSYIRSRFEDSDDKATAHYLHALRILDDVLKNDSNCDIVVQSARQSWPANEDSTPYRSNTSFDEQ